MKLPPKGRWDFVWYMRSIRLCPDCYGMLETASHEGHTYSICTDCHKEYLSHSGVLCIPGTHEGVVNEVNL